MRLTQSLYNFLQRNGKKAENIFPSRIAIYWTIQDTYLTVRRCRECWVLNKYVNAYVLFNILHWLHLESNNQLCSSFWFEIQSLYIKYLKNLMILLKGKLLLLLQSYRCIVWYLCIYICIINTWYDRFETFIYQ